MPTTNLLDRHVAMLDLGAQIPVPDPCLALGDRQSTQASSQAVDFPLPLGQAGAADVRPAPRVVEDSLRKVPNR